MLKRIPPIISPELIKILMEMGNEDELVIGNNNLPTANIGQRIVRLDEHDVSEIFKSILKFLLLDTYTETSFLLIKTTGSDKSSNHEIWREYKNIVYNFSERDIEFKEIEKFNFNQRVEKASTIIASSESNIYSNIILKKIMSE